MREIIHIGQDAYVYRRLFESIQKGEIELFKLIMLNDALVRLSKVDLLRNRIYEGKDDLRTIVRYYKHEIDFIRSFNGIWLNDHYGTASLDIEAKEFGQILSTLLGITKDVNIFQKSYKNVKKLEALKFGYINLRIFENGHYHLNSYGAMNEGYYSDVTITPNVIKFHDRGNKFAISDRAKWVAHIRYNNRKKSDEFVRIININDFSDLSRLPSSEKLDELEHELILQKRKNI